MIWSAECLITTQMCWWSLGAARFRGDSAPGCEVLAAWCWLAPLMPLGHHAPLPSCGAIADVTEFCL